MEKYVVLSNKFRRFFELPTNPVAVKISSQQLDGGRPKQPSLFCDFVRRAAYGGEAVAINESDLQNFSARIILGFAEPKYADIYPRITPAMTKTIVVAPLDKASQDPDVVIIVTNPARMMEVLRVIFRITQKRLESSITCMASAVAAEATAIPYMEKKPNLTLLCGGARTIGGYQDEELAMGIPFGIFTKVAETLAEPALVTALCGCLMDDLPRHLKDAFVELGFDKSADHFYGEFSRKVFRIYLNKDERNRITSATFHYQLKFKSDEEAKKAAVPVEEALAGLAFGDTSISRSENWLDLIFTVRFPESLEMVALNREKFKAKISEILSLFASVIDKVT